jgi:hypothetical protein
VVNCVLPTAPEETLQQIFISLVDELSDLHLRLVVFLVDPTRFGIDPEDMHYLHGVNPRNPSATQDILERNVVPGVRRDMRNLCFEAWYAAGSLSTVPVPSGLAGPSSRTSAPSDWTSTTSSPWRKAAQTPKTSRANYGEHDLESRTGEEATERRVARPW